MKGIEMNLNFEPVKGIISYLASSVNHRPLMWGMPFSAGIELTNFCNLACYECPSGSGIMKRPRGFMSGELFDKITGESDSGLHYANLYFQGEPMMHPQFFSFIARAPHLRLTMSTNGHFLGGENAYRIATSTLDRVIVSIDGMDSETYLLYRKHGDLDMVISGVRQVSEAIRSVGSSVRLVIQFLVNRFNESQIAEARKFAKANGASLRLKSMQIINPDLSEYWLPGNKRFRRYIKIDGEWRIKSHLTNRCSRLWFNPVITWDGLVIPCCFDKDACHVMGDIKVNSLREIWYGEKYMKFRQSLLENRSNIAMCRNCTSGLSGVSF